MLLRSPNATPARKWWQLQIPRLCRTAIAAVLTLTALSGTLLAAPDLEAFQPSRTPVSPAGTRAAADLPPDQHMRNTGGMGRGGPGTGAGLCVFTSFEVMDRYQGANTMAGFQKWMTKKPGSGNPTKLAAMISQFCKEKGIPEPDYVQHTGGDVRFLELAIKTRRMVGVTYAGSDDFYAGPIDHMVDLVHLDPDSACIVDNNRPGVFVWMTRAEFLTRWRARGGGWAVVLLNSPPPPASGNPLPLPPTQQYYQYPNCPNGRCPVAVAAPIAAAVPKVDRSQYSVYVRRHMGRGVSECGTGTVIASEQGKSLVLTNAHVIPDATRPVSVYVGTKEYPARLFAVSRLRPDEVDLALLTIDATLDYAPFADTAAAVGATVYQWGYGGKFEGQEPTFKTGVTVAPGDYVGPKTLRTTIPSQDGDSGSGIFDSEGRIVAVGWGGDVYQFCVKLDPARKWVLAHAGEQFPTLTGQKAAAPQPHAVPNHGIDREELDQLTTGGQHRFWIRDRETTEKGVFDALSNGLVDDSDRYFLSVMGDDATRKQLDAWFADARFAKYRDKLHVKVFPRESWVVRDRLKALVTLQDPKGILLGTLDKLEMELLLALLQQVFDPKPPPAPPVPAPNAQPNPAPNAAPNAAPNQQPHADPVPAPAPSDDKWKWILLAAIAAGILFRRSTPTPTPTPEK